MFSELCVPSPTFRVSAGLEPHTWASNMFAEIRVMRSAFLLLLAVRFP